MIIGMLAFLLAAVLILLLIPIRYTVTLVRWRLTLSVSVLLGLWRKGQAESARAEKKGPSLWREIRFAMGNGLAERVLHAAGNLLSHSFPRRCRIRGDFGTGDPMTTGIACGMAMAFLAQETKEIRWNYLEPVNTLSGEAKGRIIPLTMIYIAGRLLLSRPAREFWHFRKEEKNHG